MWKSSAVVMALLMVALLVVSSQVEGQRAAPAVRDAIAEAQAPPVGAPAPLPQDQGDRFDAAKAEPSSSALDAQPERGQATGFDFVRDPLNAKRPMQTFDETMKADVADKAKVMQLQRKLLESRYDLSPRLDPAVKMSRGKPVPVGPTARLASGLSWDSLAKLSPEEIKRRGVFPYPPLPHPKHVTGGQVFPAVQTRMFPRLERFDVEFDLPEPFLPEFPPAIFLNSRPELGDVSRGEVVSINNYLPALQGRAHARPARRAADAADAVPAGGVQPDRRPQERAAEPRGDVLRLPRQRPHDRTVPPEPGRPAPAPPRPPRHREPARRVQPADPRLQAQPALDRGLHGVRDPHRLLQRRPHPRHEEGVHHHPARAGRPHGPDAEHARLPAGAEAGADGAARPAPRRRRASCAARRSSTARVSAPAVTRGRPSSTTRCTTCGSSVSPRSPATGP